MFISQSETSKFKISKCSNPGRIGNSLHFALSLTVSEISANFWNFLKFFEIFEMFKNVLLWSLTTSVITKFRPFRSISYGFWVLNFKFKFKNWFFLKWPPFGQFLPDFCQKLISTSFQYTGYSYKILNHFIQPYVLYRYNRIFFKLLNF